ncbi:hypothetical protein CVT26_015736 [Gymnopilus dilepis]|uniref:F-box domain-containing protein n=1 Tax=Gymnopilus dilepis TaxID=231916 RepID=A0A409VFL5_9AGAR|nr:hypothetical protein CVT26_015736 [Gymnopilus dilepis]
MHIVPSSIVEPEATAVTPEVRVEAAELTDASKVSAVSTDEPPHELGIAPSGTTVEGEEGEEASPECSGPQPLDPSVFVLNNVPKNGSNGLPNVAGTCPGLEKFDIDIQHIDYLMEKLCHRRAMATWKRNQCIPVAKLPVEIIAEIFMFGSAITFAEGQTTEDATIWPLTLGRICYDWRSIAWNLAPLWTHFTCRVSNKKCAVQAELLKEWLDRSDDRLLYIRLTMEDEDAWASEQVTSIDIIDALVLHCRKWRRINLILPACWYASIRGVRGKLDNLVKVYVRPPSNSSVDLALDAFLDAPHLDRIIVSYYYLHDLYFPWAQLTKVVMVMASMDEALELIRRCPNLVTCRFDNLIPFEQQFPIDLVFNTNLQAFDASVEASAYIEHLLMYLVLPSLSGLALTLRITHSNPLPGIESLIERSSAPLKRVAIQGTYVPEDDAIEFLKHNDCVSHITTMP